MAQWLRRQRLCKPDAGCQKATNKSVMLTEARVRVNRWHLHNACVCVGVRGKMRHLFFLREVSLKIQTLTNTRKWWWFFKNPWIFLYQRWALLNKVSAFCARIHSDAVVWRQKLFFSDYIPEQNRECTKNINAVLKPLMYSHQVWKSEKG